MTTAWLGGDGATITGTLTSGAAPPTAGPTPSSPPTTSTYAVSITQSSCVVLSRDSFRTHYRITASGSVTGPDNNSGLVVSSNVSGGGLQESVSCGSWAPAPASDLGTDCRRQPGQPVTTTWSVEYANYSLGHQQVDGGFVISAHAKNAASGNLSDSESVALNCAR